MVCSWHSPRVPETEERKRFRQGVRRSRVLGLITEEQFFQLFSLSKKITNWAGNGDEDIGINPDMERKDVKIENEIGVAVIYDKKKQDVESYWVYKKGSGNEDDSDNDNAYKTDANAPIRIDGSGW